MKNKSESTKVHYNKDTGEIIAYYPYFESYKNILEPNISIDDETYNKCHSGFEGSIIVDIKNKKIDFIKISDKEIEKRKILISISTLESQINNRRIREAILGIDNNWLKNQEDSINILRKELKKII